MDLQLAYIQSCEEAGADSAVHFAHSAAVAHQLHQGRLAANCS